jgi:hypothetical protein
LLNLEMPFMKPTAGPFVLLRRLTVNAAYWDLNMEADVHENSCMDIVSDYNPPDSGSAYKKLNIVPR